MTKARAVRPFARVAPLLEGLSAPEATERLAHPDPALAQVIARTGADPARLVIDAWEELSLAPDARRHAGVYYTPPHVIDAMLERVPLDGPILDPAAGAGAFLVALARRLGPGALARLHACDVEPGALDAAALALEVALGPSHAQAVREWRRTNAFALDFLREPWTGPAPALVVGNPPYRVTGDADLGARFPALRGERDLYACFVLRALDVVHADGTVALLVPDTWLTNRNAASLREELLRRSGLARVVDFGKPFASARDTRVHALVLRRGAATCEVESERGAGLEPMAPVPRPQLERTAPAGWLLYRKSNEARACSALERAATRFGDSLDVVYGLRTGNNAAHVGAGDGAVPLVGGLDFDAFDRAWTPKHLVDPSAFPSVLARQRGRWKIGIQRIRTNSSVSWRRWLEGALVDPREVGLDSLTLVADRAPAPEPSEALHAALGVLNSSLLNRWYRLAFTDVNVKPAYVVALPLPPFDPDLATAVKARLASPGDLVLERAIDRLVARAYGLSEDDVEVLESAFWGAERARRPLPSLEQALAISRTRAPRAPAPDPWPRARRAARGPLRT